MSGPLRGGSVLVEVLKANEDRVPRGVRLKLKRMSESAFAFFRGTCHLFAASWGALKTPDDGPEILACGDLHLENFGAYRDERGEFFYDINDFDEALFAPCAVDPVRCVSSILLASELWGLSPLRATGMALAYLDAYRNAVTTPSPDRRVDAASAGLALGPVSGLLGKAETGRQGRLLDGHTDRLKNGTRRIVRCKSRHPEIDPKRAAQVAGAVQSYGERTRQPEAYRVLDVTGRVAGVGSLGLERFLVLVAGGGSVETNRLLDVKETRPSAWLGHLGRTADTGAGEAERVVRAQRTLQARHAAGLDVLDVGGAGFRVREMIPEENRSSLDRFQRRPTKLRQAIVVAGRLTGLSHLRGSQAAGGSEAAEALAVWARGSALDSVLASAARHAEQTRVDYKQFKAERRAPDALPEPLRKKMKPAS